MTDTAVRERVAVVVVHGIADQRIAETAAAVAAQIAAGERGVVMRSDVPIAVMPLEPAVPFERWKPENLRERISKSLRQSLRSDFLDPQLGARPTAEGKLAARNSAAHADDSLDHGVRFTDYLLAKAASVRTGPPAIGHYEMPCLRVDTAQRRTDVFEMYWADLSRLGGGPTRIVTEFFTLLFHLSKLGADTLGLAQVAGTSDGSVGWLSRLHSAANWLFSRGLALLFLQLLMSVMLLVPAALLAGQEGRWGVAAAVIAGAATAVAVVYAGHKEWIVGFWSGVITAGLLAWAAWQQPAAAAWAVLAAWSLALLWCYQQFLGFCEERFRAVYGVGWVLMAATIASVAWGALSQHGGGAAEHVVAGVLRAVEVMLLGQLVSWVLMAALVAAAVLLGEYACRRSSDAALHQSIVTARLGLFVSIGIFIALVMTVWALLSQPLQDLVNGFHYTPWWFTDAATLVPMDAACFLELRFTNSTDTFALVAVMLLVLLGFLSLVFLPSVLVELRLAGWFSAVRLGHWLTAGYRALDRLVRWWSFVIVAMLLGVAVLLLGSQLARFGIALPWIGELSLPVGTWSGTLLQKAVVVLAGGAVSLVAIGSVAVKRLKALRAPLDAALDVDNHFREFPRAAIPRVLIIERYVALLEHVLRGGYDRVVIVAHSQGSVITADLLRYLQRRARLMGPAVEPSADRLVQLGAALAAKNIRLLTAGCPLRQLYALRFATQYRWVMADAGGLHSGPHPRRDLGVAHWVNVWGAGDYVGRWLWTAARDASLPPLAVDEQAYAGVPAQHAPDYRDLCLGAEAHTHYFELQQAAMMAELRALL